MRRAPNLIDQHIGGQLRAARLLREMSQNDLGKKLGLSFQQIQKYENGSNRISASRLYQFSKILSVNVSAFYDGLHIETGLPVSQPFPEYTRTQLDCMAHLKQLPPPTFRRIYALVKALSGGRSR